MGCTTSKNAVSNTNVDGPQQSGSSAWDDFSSDDDKRPMGEPKRRRLSISTLSGPANVHKANEKMQQSMQKEPSNSKTQPKRRLSVTEALEKKAVPGISGMKRTEPDMEDELVSGDLVSEGHFKLEGPKYAEAFKSLFPNAKIFAVFGGDTYESQSGFDNKEPDFVGHMPAGMTLRDFGIGFACRKGLKLESPNQDNFCILRFDDWSLYGVFDGHGPYGHDVAAFVHRCLPYLIVSHPDFFNDCKVAIEYGFARTDQLVKRMGDWNRSFGNVEDKNYWDDQLSGTTCTICIVKDDIVTIGHVGDSRAISGKLVKTGKKPKGTELTRDHKPNIKSERARIIENGGQVRKLEGDVPHRVFVANEHFPGLAMSRTLGDLIAQMVGVSPVPEINQFHISEKDLFLFISSDGVWEFLSTDTVVNLVHKHGVKGCQAAADEIALRSWQAWLKEEENVVDDITCLVIWNESVLRDAHKNEGT